MEYKIKSVIPMDALLIDTEQGLFLRCWRRPTPTQPEDEFSLLKAIGGTNNTMWRRPIEADSIEMDKDLLNAVMAQDLEIAAAQLPTTMAPLIEKLQGLLKEKL